MNKRLGWAMVIGTFAVTGCVSAPEGPGYEPPTFEAKVRANNHWIVVTVEQGRIVVDVPRLHVAGANHVIFWNIDNDTGQGYTFPADGIRFTSQNAGDQIWSCDRVIPTRFRCKGGKSPGGGAMLEFKYVVSVAGTPAVAPLDPFVVNN